ncbi:MAG TPA: M20/M25/M40 family metallo-hydrolase, partial [Thermoanaerobaculia bacterium]|nr:M20/M25/M40 family metallo-hydrolase [Thermoanaerobaculia bacterium]
LDDLVALCRIPSVSALDAPSVRASAKAFADVLRRYGLQKVRLLESDNAHPSVYGEWSVAEGDAARRPTLLIYGHHDVQPPGAIDRWASPPFEPEVRNGRLYGRGTADDKGGIMAHIAAVGSQLGRDGTLPCNVKFLIEGEEEIGSPHLGNILRDYGDLLGADYVVLNDTPNFATGVPALTYRLRGMCHVDVEVQCLTQPLHSGRGGGVVPDPVAILCHLIDSVDLEVDGITPLSPDEKARLDALPFTHEFPLADGVELLARDVQWERLWTRPSMTVIGFDAHPIAGSFNQILPSARARLSIRTVPNLDSRAAGEAIARQLIDAGPPHARVRAEVVSAAPWFRIEPQGPAFDAAMRALERGYGRKPVLIGAGGTIGFVGTFAEQFAGVPLLLMGVEDPPCNAHSENESLHLGDWEKCTRSAMVLYEELGRLAT